MDSETKAILERIEDTQRDMGKTLNKLVAVEIQQQADREVVARYGKVQDEHALRIHNLEISQAKQSWFYDIGKGAITKVVMWLVGVVTVVGGAGYVFSQ